MKNFLLKNKIFIVIIMAILFLLMLTGKSNASSENYIFIGDSRTYHMIGGYYSPSNYDWNTGYTTGRAQEKFTNKVLKSHAIVGASYDTFFSNYNRVQKIEQSLQTAPSGTKAIIWLGVNDIANAYVNPTDRANKYAMASEKLARKFPKVDFYYVSVTAVNENQSTRCYSSYLNNNRIDQLNSIINTRIKSANLSNLSFVDINSSLKSRIQSDSSLNVGDGLHYTTSMYKEISNMIYEKVNTKKEETEKTETHLVDFSKAVKKHSFYPDTYLKVKSDDKLGHIENPKDQPYELKGRAIVRFYTDKTYTLTTSNGTYKMIKVQMNGKTGYINANFLNEKFYVKLHILFR